MDIYGQFFCEAGRGVNEFLARMPSNQEPLRGLVDENALYNALSTGKLSGAALDVFKDEPYKGALTELPNIVLTAHVGSYAKEARILMEEQAVKNLLQGLGA